MMAYLQLAMVAACPIVASTILYIFEKKVLAERAGNWLKQILFGIVFGGISILGTEFGVPINGAVINVRDAAPLCAGLIFGAPAGIIAGVIGGIERWFAVLWGAGTYTRLACSISTILAGLLAAALRKWMFDDKKPTWHYGLATAIVMEVLHMLMIFFTNMGDVQQAFYFVKKCSAPMILVNSLSVMLSMLVVALIGKEKLRTRKTPKGLSQTFSRWLLLMVVVSFSVTSVFTYVLQTKSSVTANETLLRTNVDDIKEDIEDASDANLLKLTRNVADDINAADELNDKLLSDIRQKPGNDFSEISVIDENGIITHSSSQGNIGYDMAAGEQSRAFLVLLTGRKELVQRYQPMSRDGSYMKYAGVALRAGGFVQVGYNAARFRQNIDAQVVGATRNRHVGESGRVIIVADDWRIVSGQEDSEFVHFDLEKLRASVEATQPRTRFEVPFFTEAYYCMYTTTEGYYIIAVEPVSEALFSRDLSVYVTVFMEILVFAVLFVLIYFLTKKLVVENIQKVNATLGEITEGNLDVSVNVRTNEEFVSLSDDINTTVDTLKGYIAEAAARIDKELEVAKVIQSSSLPRTFPPYPERTDLDIFATMDAAKEVGGDFYDFYLLDENRLAFLVADVSGKGITAAMFMMKAKTLLKDYAEKEASVSRILQRANEALCEGNDAEMFVTCWMGILDLTTHTVDFANAGHNPPLIRHKNGSFKFFKSKPCFVLGGMEGMPYRGGTFTLEAGDEIYLYTDGVTEATDAHNELYGDDRLNQILNTFTDKSAEEICRAVKSDVDAFVGEAPQFDDMTMLCLRMHEKNTISLRPTPESMDAVTTFVENSLDAAGVPQKAKTKLLIAVDEIYSNIIRYSGAESTELACHADHDEVVLTFTDDGKPYNPLEQAAPDITLGAEDRDIGGLGIFMVKKTMDHVNYQYKNKRNVLTITKKL